MCVFYNTNIQAYVCVCVCLAFWLCIFVSQQAKTNCFDTVLKYAKFTAATKLLKNSPRATKADLRCCLGDWWSYFIGSSAADYCFYRIIKPKHCAWRRLTTINTHSTRKNSFSFLKQKIIEIYSLDKTYSSSYVYVRLRHSEFCGISCM